METWDLSDLAPIEVPVIVGEKKYTLREATGDAAARYRNALMSGTELGPNGKPIRIRDMADTEALLVSLCLFDEHDKRVHISIIRGWPNRIVKQLYDKASEISELGEEAEETAKNALSSTGDGSV